MGMSSALDTLSGQCYGAKQYHMMGIHMQRAMFVLLLVCIPLAIISANTRIILIALGQDADISTEAGKFARFNIPSLFAYALLQCLVRFLQTQNIVFPMMLSESLLYCISLSVGFLCLNLDLEAGEPHWQIPSLIGSMCYFWCFMSGSLQHAQKLGQAFRRRPFKMLLHFLDSLFHQLSWSGNSNFLISQKVTSYYLELSFNIYNLFGVNCFLY